MEISSNLTAFHRLDFLEEIKKDLEIELKDLKIQFEEVLSEINVSYIILNIIACKMRCIMDDISETEERIKIIRLEILN